MGKVEKVLFGDYYAKISGRERIYCSSIDFWQEQRNFRIIRPFREANTTGNQSDQSRLICAFISSYRVGSWIGSGNT